MSNPFSNHTLTPLQITQKKLNRTWSRLIDHLSHDLSGPLVTARLRGKALHTVLPSLLKGYQLAVKQKLMPEEINEKFLTAFQGEFLSDFEQQFSRMLNFLELVQLYKDQSLNNAQEIKPLSAKTSIQELLQNYPFENEQTRHLIQFDSKNDFIFRCSPLFIEHLFSNLLTNALNAIWQAGKGTIYIWMTHEQDTHIIHFKDTGLGMDDDTHSRIFDRFFYQKQQNTVPGLGFCRLAILQLGGDITCDAVKNEYTHFMIRFPRE